MMTDAKRDAIATCFSKPEAKVLQAQEPVAWFAFADSNGPVPLELWGFDQKACKHAVLENARSVGWKGTIEGYLFQKGWTIRPLVFPAPQPPAPCPLCARLQDELADALDVKNGHGPTALSMVIADRDAMQAKVAILDGLSQDAIDGGWTYRGMEAYAKGLEAKVAEQAAEIERLNRGMTVYTEAFEAECRTTDEQSALIEQLGGAITRQHDSGEQLATRVMEQAALIAEYEAALSNITQYAASNGDTWPADMAFAAIAAHKKGIAQ